MKFLVEIRDYASSSQDEEWAVNTADIEEAIQALLDERGDDGMVIVTEVNE